MYAVGIDIGTTSICGVLIDAKSGRVVKSRTEMSEAFLATENDWEKIQDAEKVIGLAMDILKELLQYPVSVIGLTGQMHGILYVDAQGKAVSPLYTWQDGRGNLSYKESTYAAYLNSNSGYGNVTDFYNRCNGLRPENAVTHCTIMDYLAMVLCDRKEPWIHTTNAASLGCFDLESNQFTYDGISTKVSTGFDIVGTYQGIPVSVAIGDNQASVFSTLSAEEDLLINVGTGSQISIISDKMKVGDNIETRPYFEENYLIVGSALCGGRAYSILKNFYTTFLQAAGIESVDVYEVMERMIANTSENLLKVDARFAGTRHDPKITGQISGIKEENFTPENLTYGFLQGMMEELFEMYTQMGETRGNLVGSGNGIRKNHALRTIAEKRFEGSLRVPAHTEEAAFGAALFGLVACGAYEGAKQVQQLIRYEEI